MKAFLTSLMAILLAAHSAFGCCWHHAHAYDGLPNACCNHNDHDGLPDEPPCDVEKECEGTCQYVAAEKVRVDHLGDAGWAVFVVPNVTFAESTFSSLVRSRESFCPIDSGPPLRLHLLHQLLLI